MNCMKELEPGKVFYFFEEICKIPHGSGNVKAISDYLAEFAKERSLEYWQDELRNIVIVKEATSGYENEEPVILQGHMDMVAVKKPGCAKNMASEGLDLRVDGDDLYAEGTSLGGDDGIAVAYMLALLDDGQISHPRLEAVITVDEEVGMDGAAGIDLSMCKGRRMLNLDSEEEGIFLTSCAGGARVHGKLPVETEEKQGCIYILSLEGLMGGHSGAEIDKERGNSNVLSGRLLHWLGKNLDVRVVSLEGGLADNAIPRQTKMVLFVESGKVRELEQAIAGFRDILRKELAVKDPNVDIVTEKTEEGLFRVLTQNDTHKTALLLYMMPNGVQAMSADIPGLVQTSLNLGILKLDVRTSEEAVLEVDYSIRSSVQSEKDMLLDKTALLISFLGGSTQVSGEYPAWEYRKDSLLREKMVGIYREMYGKEPQIQAIHAGLECGILAAKLPGLDCVSFGPDMKDIHTTEEKLSISSVKRVWEYLRKILERKD